MGWLGCCQGGHRAAATCPGSSFHRKKLSCKESHQNNMKHKLEHLAGYSAILLPGSAHCSLICACVHPFSLVIHAECFWGLELPAQEAAKLAFGGQQTCMGLPRHWHINMISMGWLLGG